MCKCRKSLKTMIKPVFKFEEDVIVKNGIIKLSEIPIIGESIYVEREDGSIDYLDTIKNEKSIKTNFKDGEKIKCSYQYLARVDDYVIDCETNNNISSMQQSLIINIGDIMNEIKEEIDKQDSKKDNGIHIDFIKVYIDCDKIKNNFKFYILNQCWEVSDMDTIKDGVRYMLGIIKNHYYLNLEDTFFYVTSCEHGLEIIKYLEDLKCEVCKMDLNRI